MAEIYGIILYTDEHANIKKALNDEVYWNAFDEISGKDWVVFATKQKSGKLNNSSLPPGQMRYMEPIWKEPNENIPLIKFLGLKSTKKLPVLVSFTQYKSDILKSTLELDDSSVDNAYNSIKKSIKLITDSIEKISPDNLDNPDELHKITNRSVNIHKFWSKFKKGVNILVWIKDLIPN